MTKGQLEFYTVGTQAWIPDEEAGWVLIKLISINKNNGALTFKREDNSQLVEIKPDADESNLPPLHNPPILESVDDLTALSYLHEPAVLHNVNVRYRSKVIYTFSGIVLVALNPYQKLPIYEQNIIQAYAKKSIGELDPHLFAVAEDAFRCMVTQRKNQSIIVTGESGAGKTVSTKYVMRYFASVDHSDAKLSEVEEQVMATNPVMEAFGNAKTIRNNNSSRFGKYIEIHFNKDSKITGASIRTYLLERSRVVFQAEDERNYHIFYQLCAGIASAERKNLRLSSWDSYQFLSQGGDGTIEGVSDTADFAETQSSLSKIGMPVSDQWKVFKLLAAILHLGNVKISVEAKGEYSSVHPQDPSLLNVCDLLEIDNGSVAKWICNRQIVTKFESIVTPRNASDATATRDSLAKFLYSKLFDWIVAQINKSLFKEAKNEGFIGLLDIYGFEIFKINSFEQFCINYANERLQQEFVQHVFKLEQEEYVKEGITWSFINYTDNQPCINLIAGNLGIFSLLDEECIIPKGTDATFAQKVIDKFSTHNFFAKPRFSNVAFIIKHYAQDVCYECDGFLDKNRDTISDELEEVLLATKDPLLAVIFGGTGLKKTDLQKIQAGLNTIKKGLQQMGPQQGSEKGASKIAKPTLGFIFKSSLNELMETLKATTPHYIRCIKPNEQKTPFGFDPVHVLQQLRACGVLETIKISAAGYPSRSFIDEFVDRYKILVHSKFWEKEHRALASQVLNDAFSDPDKFQIGKTKIFLRAGQLAYLEKKRNDKLRACSVVIQKNYRRAMMVRWYTKVKKSILIAQKVVRGHQARRLYGKMRMARATEIVCKFVLRNVVRKRFRALRRALVTLQSAMKVKKATALLKKIREHRAAIVLQKNHKRVVAVRQFRKTMKLVVFMQCCIRRRLARRVYRALRAEANSLQRFKEVSYKLENKVIELTQNLSAKDQALKALEEERLSSEQHGLFWQEKFRAEKELRLQAEATISELRSEIEQQALSFEQEKRSLVADVQVKISHLKKTVTTQQSSLNQAVETVAKLEEENEKLQAKISEKDRKPSTGVHTLEELQRENEQLNAQLSLVLKHLAIMKEHDVVLDPALVSLMREKNVLTVQRPKEHEKEKEKEKEREKEKSRDWVFVDETSSTVFSFEGDYEKEITTKLILNNKTPAPLKSQKYEKEFILFPSHVMALVFKRMVETSMYDKIQSLLIEILRAIQTVVQKSDDVRTIAYWLSNIDELRCLFSSLDALLRKESRGVKAGPGIPKSLSKLLNDIHFLETELVQGFLKKAKESLERMIISAVLENEGLPGVKKQPKSPMKSISHGPQFTPQIFLIFLAEISQTLRDLFIDEEIIKQVFSHLFFHIGASAFNNLLLRKDLCSSRRGMQIQYNVSQIEQWAVENGFSEAGIHMLMTSQAAKLLQIKMVEKSDIDFVLDFCFLLNPTQIYKLLSMYRDDETEKGIPAALLEYVSKKVLKANEELAINAQGHAPFSAPAPRVIPSISNFLPKDISLTVLSYIQAKGISKESRMSEEFAKIDAQLRALNLKQLDLVKKEYESRLPKPVNSYKTRNDLIVALATIMAGERAQEDVPEIASQLPVVFNQFLEKRTKLDAIRAHVIKMFKNKFFSSQKEFEESLKFVESLASQFMDNHCRILVVGNNSSGKSLFLNLLLGAEVLPFTALPCTSVICEIQRSEEKRFIVKDFDGKVVVDQSLDVPGQKPRDILQPYIFTQGADRNVQGKYKSVHIFWPTPILGPGIVLVDSPGLEENDTMTDIVDKYIDTATALICVIDSTQGAITDSLRRTLKRVSLDMAEKKENEMQTSIHREAVLFVCNKWDLVTVGQQKEVFDNIMDHAKKFWSPDVTENQFLKMNTEAAFIARIQQGRDNVDARNLKVALNSFLENAFRFKLHNLWFNINVVCLRGDRVVRSRSNMLNRTEQERAQIVKDARIRLDKLLAHSNNPDTRRNLLEDHEKLFQAAKDKLRDFLRSSEVRELVEKWAENFKDPDPYNFDTSFVLFLEKLIEDWELRHKYFKTAELQSMKQLATLVHMAESERKLVERLVSGDTLDVQVDSTSQMSTGLKVLIGVTSPIWIPLVVIASPVILIALGARLLREKSKEVQKSALEKQREKQYTVDRRKQIAADVQDRLENLPSMVDTLTSKMFLNTENFIKKVFSDLSLRIAFDRKQIDFIEADEGNQAEMRTMLESAAEISFIVVCDVRNYFIENLRRDSIDRSKITLGIEIGSGASSKVFDGTYEQTPVAVKVLTTNETFVINAFFQEEEVLRSLKHPFILPFYGSYIETLPEGDRKFCIVTERADRTLRSHLKSLIVRDDRLQMMKDLASAIGYMHQNGYIHRDLKPENILVKGGRLRVADVGMTRKTFDVTGSVTGTPLYMAPEVLRHQYDEKVDVFSFGRILWEIWFLESSERYFPRNADPMTVISRGFDLPRTLFGREDPPPQLAELLVRCCKFNSSERPNFETIIMMLQTIQ